MTIDAQFYLDRGDFKLDVEFSIPGHGVTSILGPSGCGKTTLLRAIAGLENCQGRLTINNKDWQTSSFFMPCHERSLAYVFQETSLFEHLDVQGNLNYGLKRTATGKQKISLNKTIELFGISKLLKRRVHQLSGGEKQRVSIARALAVSPDILLMDEPLAALDLTRKLEILPYLENIHKEFNIPLIYVSHSADEVARLADHIVLLEQGKVIGNGAITDVFTRLDLPLAHSDQAESIIHAQVAEHDEHYNLTYLSFSGGVFSVSKKDLPIGQAVRVRILARDVSLTLQHQKDTSMLNIFPAIVQEIIAEGIAQLTVKLNVNGAIFLSRITQKSADLLKLKKGKMVFLQAKSVALLA